jgi:hypothetical protein
MTAAVGRQGSGGDRVANRPEDVKEVVKLFMMIEPADGGFRGLPPQPALQPAEGGVCDDFLVGVITRFQNRWSQEIKPEAADKGTSGRVFPSSRTMTQLRLLGSKPTTPKTAPVKTGPARSPEDEFLARAKKLVATADSWRDSAEKVLYWARCALDSPGENAFNDQALVLVNRCFKVNEHTFTTFATRDIDRIKAVFRNIADFYSTVKTGTEYLTLGPAIRPDDQAYAAVGGWARKDKSGLTFVLARCKGKSDEDLTDIIMHESVHFAGGIDHYLIGVDPAYGEKVFTLTNSQALQNASSYSYLAYIARMNPALWATAT